MTVTVLVLDSVGVGALPDAENFGDVGAHTLDHCLEATGVRLPTLASLGLGNIAGVRQVPAQAQPRASYGRMAERSPGKDTSTGHWEFMGIVLEQAFQTFQHFPAAVMQAFDQATGRGHLGNYPASGTEIIEALGEEHLKTGKPIVYTSADSVFQIAAHVDVTDLDTLYHYCQVARELLQGEYAVARVIARPFEGSPGDFRRLGHARKDFSLSPPQPTVLNALEQAGKAVIGVGKIPDIYNHSGISQAVPSHDNLDGLAKTLQLMQERPDGLIFCNLVEFDSLYGHRRDPLGYANALRAVDERLEPVLAAVSAEDLLLIISDHGNDPTWPGSDHTREYGLLLAYNPLQPGRDLGTRASFADVGASVAAWLEVPWQGVGSSFLL